MSHLDKLLEGVEVDWKSLDEVATFRRGSFPQPYGNSEWYDGEGAMPFVQVIDVGHDMRLVEETKNKISKLAQPKSVFVPKDTVIVTLQGSIGRVAITQYDSYVDRTLAIFEQFQIEIDKKYFLYQLQEKFRVEKETARGDIIKTITKEDFKKFQIPIPPLSVQKEIVRILDSLSEHTTELIAELKAEFTARKKQYNYYREQLLGFENSDVEWKSLGEVCLSITAGGDVPVNSIKGQTAPSDEYPYPIYANAVGEGGLYGFTDEYKIESDAVTISARGAKVGYHTIREGKFTPIIRLITLVTNKNIVSTKFLNYILYLTPIGGNDGGIPQLTVPDVKKLRIAIPSLEEQDRIVSILDKFDTLTTSISEGLPKEIELRQKQYEYYRELLLIIPKVN
jgi:type I restriction enzyme S subunit